MTFNDLRIDRAGVFQRITDNQKHLHTFHLPHIRQGHKRVNHGVELLGPTLKAEHQTIQI